MTAFAFHFSGCLSVSGSSIFIIKFQHMVMLAHHVPWVFLGHVIKQGIFPNLPRLISQEYHSLESYSRLQVDEKRDSGCRAAQVP